MKRPSLTIALSLALASCATMPTGYPKARGSIERIEAAYQRVRGPAEAAIARLPGPVAARVRATLFIADAAFAVTRSDAAPLTRVAAARNLGEAVFALKRATK